MDDAFQGAGPLDKSGRRKLERDAFGFPVAPPGRVTLAGNLMRRGVKRLARVTAPPPLQILEAMFGQFDAHALRALVELGIPDKLDGSPTVDELAATTGTDAAKLGRVIRYAAGRGFLTLDSNDRVGATALSAMLQRNAVAPWRGWIEFLGSDWVDGAFRQLTASLGPDSPPPFELAHGASFFEFTTRNPEAGRAFDRAMEAGSTAQAVGLARELDWHGVTSVCDVGGGTGAALDVLQRYHPHLNVTLLDLPEVVAEHRLEPIQGVGLRDVVGASFFDEVPARRERYLLLAIIHDWADEEAAAILGNIRSVLAPGGKVIVVETVLSDRPVDDFATATDLLMYVVATGRERTRAQYKSLWALAGFSEESAKPIVSGATAFTLAPA